MSINNLVIGNYYTVYALRNGVEDKSVWVIVACGKFDGVNNTGQEYWFVSDKKDYSGYVYGINVDTVINNRAIANKYKFVQHP